MNTSLHNIDWDLLKTQKELLFKLVNDPKRPQDEVDLLDGVLNLLDAIQDVYEPTKE